MRKIFSLVLVFVMAAGFAPLVVAAAPTPDTGWYYTRPNAAEFTITTADQLAGLAVIVNSGNDFAGKTVTLGASLDISAYGADSYGGYNGGKGWTPIGTDDNPFCGTFDGNHNVISGCPFSRKTQRNNTIICAINKCERDNMGQKNQIIC